jgi:hypothetical protein
LFAVGVTDFGDAEELTDDLIEEMNQPSWIDCNENGTYDGEELSSGTEHDTDGDGLLDGCEPLSGDVDEDADVDWDDGDLLIGALGKEGGLPGYLELADLDLDQVVDEVDLDLWSEARMSANGLPPHCTGAGTDADSDGVIDSCDNCLALGNAGQQDSNLDGYGNRCDGDFNNDGGVTATDLGLFKQAYLTAEGYPNWNPAADLNSDGVVNAIDFSQFKALYLMAPGPSGLECASQPLCWAMER